MFMLNKPTLREMMRKKQGIPLIFLLNDTDIPYTMWVLLNGHDMWDHKWKYHQDNPFCNGGDRIKYLKYNGMRAGGSNALFGTERDEYFLYKDKGGRFTDGISKKPFHEAVSDEGRKMLMKLTRKWCQFLREHDKEKFNETWQAIERDELLEEKIWMGSMKRKRDIDKLPPLPDVEGDSPRGVILFPGDEGYDDWIMGGEGDDSSDDEV